MSRLFIFGGVIAVVGVCKHTSKSRLTILEVLMVRNLSRQWLMSSTNKHVSTNWQRQTNNLNGAHLYGFCPPQRIPVCRCEKAPLVQGPVNFNCSFAQLIQRQFCHKLYQEFMALSLSSFPYWLEFKVDIIAGKLMAGLSL